MWSDAIVVGTDGSPTADAAVTHAGEIARAFGSAVHVVCSYETHLTGGWVGAAPIAVAELTAVEQARDHAEQVVARARARLAGLDLTVHSHVRRDEPAHALVAVADERHARMIVVGNQGMNGPRRMLGSVPNRVSHQAHCAVLIVPTDHTRG